MILRCALVFLVALGLSAPVKGAWRAWPMDWASVENALVDLSGFLEDPAGQHGPVGIKDGHLVDGAGKRFRIWGVNFTGAACFPEATDAPAVARHLARFGINCVRFHFLDSNWGPEASVFDPARNDTQACDTVQLDRLDYFVAQLKEQGIYSNFNLNVGRVYRRGDGVPDYDRIGFGKALQYFDARIQYLHRDYARRLLTHRNPYTGRRYCDEPALAIVELVNENSIVESWFSDRLRGEHTGKHPGTWTDITRHYADQLTQSYNRWLRENLSPDDLRAMRDSAKVGAGEPIPRLRPSEFKSASRLRFHTEARFYMALEDQYFQDMSRLLKQDLGLKALVVGTSDHNHSRTGYPLLHSAAKLDVVDGHVYWQHPKYFRDPDTGKQSSSIGNTPMVSDPRWSTIPQLARSAVAGRPYTVSETNHPFPSEYACEGIPILAAYSLLHDWDGIFFYTFAHKDPRAWLTQTPRHFDIGADPMKMMALAGAGIMFHRADVQPARTTVLRCYNAEQVIESLRLDPSRHGPFFTPGYSPELCLMHRTAIRSFDQASEAYPAFGHTGAIVSDTQELSWLHEAGKGLVCIDTPRTQGLIGHVQDLPKSLTHLQVDLDLPFASVLLTALDGKPLVHSRRMLLLTLARAALTNMTWDTERKRLLNWGRMPMQIETVTGTVTLRGLSPEGKVRVLGLDSRARPMDVPIEHRQEAGDVRIKLGDQALPWYVVEIQ